VMEKLQTRTAWTPFELESNGIKVNLCGAAGVAAYNYNGTAQEDFLTQAHQALERAEASGYNRVCAFSGEEEAH